MKKTPLKRKSRSELARLKSRLWELCKLITRKRYGSTCYTCGKTGLSGWNQQTGHMWAKASLGTHLKYDLRVLRIQCATCNQFKGGMGADFYAKMLKIEGKEYMDQLENERQILIKANKEWFIEKIKEYKEILANVRIEDITLDNYE